MHESAKERPTKVLVITPNARELEPQVEEAMILAGSYKFSIAVSEIFVT